MIMAIAGALQQGLLQLTYLCLFYLLQLLRLSSLHLNRARNSFRWLRLKARYGLDEDRVLRELCATGQLLGKKTLTHAAIVVNSMQRGVDARTLQEVGKVADVIAWLSHSLSSADHASVVTVFDQKGRFLELQEQLVKMLQLRESTKSAVSDISICSNPSPSSCAAGKREEQRKHSHRGEQARPHYREPLPGGGHSEEVGNSEDRARLSSAQAAGHRAANGPGVQFKARRPHARRLPGLRERKRRDRRVRRLARL